MELSAEYLFWSTDKVVLVVLLLAMVFTNRPKMCYTDSLSPDLSHCYRATTAQNPA